MLFAYVIILIISCYHYIIIIYFVVTFIVLFCFFYIGDLFMFVFLYFINRPQIHPYFHICVHPLVTNWLSTAPRSCLCYLRRIISTICCSPRYISGVQRLEIIYIKSCHILVIFFFFFFFFFKLSDDICVSVVYQDCHVMIYHPRSACVLIFAN